MRIVYLARDVRLQKNLAVSFATRSLGVMPPLAEKRFDRVL